MSVYGVFYSYSDYEDGGYELMQLFSNEESASAFKEVATNAIEKNVKLDQAIMNLSSNITNSCPEFKAACDAQDNHLEKYDFLSRMSGCVDSWELLLEELEVLD